MYHTWHNCATDSIISCLYHVIVTLHVHFHLFFLHKFKGLSRMLDVQWLFLWKLIVPLPQKAKGGCHCGNLSDIWICWSEQWKVEVQALRVYYLSSLLQCVWKSRWLTLLKSKMHKDLWRVWQGWQGLFPGNVYGCVCLIQPDSARRWWALPLRLGLFLLRRAYLGGLRIGI